MRSLLLLALFGLAAPAAADPVPVVVENASHPTRCAEEDNVYVRLAAPAIASFRLSAAHPPYIGEVLVDSKEPDFTHCDMSGDPVHPGTPRAVTMHDDGRTKVVALAFGGFWRPADVPFAVGDRVERGIHLVQVFRYVDGTPIEVLVVYPPDGYWRAKPLPPAGRPETAYGSSFLIGPIEEIGRPIVAFRALRFDPVAGRFDVEFVRGGRASLTIEAAHRDATEVAVRFDPPLGNGPFAALRSMFVTPTNADVSEATWRRPDGSVASVPIMVLGREPALATRFGRTVKSTHNLSAPDMLFGDFRSRH